MMIPPELIKAVSVLAVTTGWNLTPEALEAVCLQLAKYELRAVLAGIERTMVEHRGPMTLGAIIDRIDDGHLGPEAAWAMVAHLGEHETVVWTAEIARAYAVAWPLLVHGEQVQARLAFLEAYRVELGRARVSGQRPAWHPSLGEDETGRVGPICQAVDQGRLPVAAGQRILPEHQWPDAWRTALPEVTATSQDDARQMIRQLADRFSLEIRAEQSRKAREPLTEGLADQAWRQRAKETEA